MYRAGTGQAVFESDEHILLMVPAPDEQHIALQLAGRADEAGHLAVLNVSSGVLRRYVDIHCRYDPMQWAMDSRTLSLIARDPQRLVQIEVAREWVAESPVASDARCRLFAPAPHWLAAESRAGMPTRLVRLDTGTHLVSFPTISSAHVIGNYAVLVQSGNSLHAVDVYSGAERWRWSDCTTSLTTVRVWENEVYAIAVRAGKSVLLNIADGVVQQDWTARLGESVAAFSDVSVDAGGISAVIEAPSSPPNVVTLSSRQGIGDQLPPRDGDDRAAETTWHEFRADDGCILSLIVTSPRGLVGPAPTILTCYGGFGVASLPVFEPTIPAWIEAGGRYATAHIRGGGEHGAQWRAGGYGARKRRGIDDLASAARWLVAAQLARADSLVLVGASHGGTVVASCVLGHPNICAGFVVTAAPLDLLALDQHPLGRLWRDEFGAGSDAAGQRELSEISPLSRAQSLGGDTAPPRFLGIVLAEDSRVAPDDTHAFAAALGVAGGEVTVWEAPGAGHGANHLDSLHELGAVVLKFAAATTFHGTSARTPAGTTPHTTPLANEKDATHDA